MRNFSGQSIQTSMHNLESVAQKMAELLYYMQFFLGGETSLSKKKLGGYRPTWKILGGGDG